jgi:hypothetical protein
MTEPIPPSLGYTIIGSDISPPLHGGLFLCLWAK